MTHTYQITGMTCSGCQAKVQSLLTQVNGIKKVEISLAESIAEITMQQHIPTAVLQQALAAYPKYQLSEVAVHQNINTVIDDIENKTWLQTYKPILLIFAYILAVSLIASSQTGHFQVAILMRIFMSAFFLVFSFFKLLDLRGFAESYSMYDLIAKRWSGWAYLYAFIELGLGLAYALNLAPVAVSFITFIVMSLSIIGVLQSIFNKQKIRCACLGAVFKLPMSTVTIIEDGLMILMSAWMIVA
jgi:copper chaperone CopZ/uncharacterized membrane protein YphA (DoxX/SURF4 family)